MTRIVSHDEIESVLPSINLIAAMEWAFVTYSSGRAVIPPVGELLFDGPPGDAHIKYGYVRDDDVFVIKVATGFYENPLRGLPSNCGLVLVFSSHTGFPVAVLLDEGELTNLRTAAAGAVAAKHLANPEAQRIAVLGAGVQARLQIDLLRTVTPCRQVSAWARNPSALSKLSTDLGKLGMDVKAAETPAQAASEADIIVTTTAATAPLLASCDIKPGTHITAIGSDTPHKQELDPAILGKAQVIVADSRSQCEERGEIHHALIAGTLNPGHIVELGEIISGARPGRASRDQITIADLTGVAVQDIAIAQAVLRSLGTT